MHPHEVFIDVLLEVRSFGSMPGEEDVIATLFRFLDVSYLALTEAAGPVSRRASRQCERISLHLCAPVPGIADVVHQSTTLGAIVHTG